MPKPSPALRAIYNVELPTDWLGTSGQPTASQFADIAEAGYQAVINLALPSSDNAIANEGSIVTGHGMAYFHIPVAFDNPTIADLRVFFGVMNALEGRKVWVHCVVNARVSAFVYQYLRIARGVDDEAAKTQLLAKWLPEMDEVWRGFLALPREEILGSA
jgi:protein tyrosine phosphatase (PTP) superfamily phosphohydrolase (DUF442 family)